MNSIQIFATYIIPLNSTFLYNLYKFIQSVELYNSSLNKLLNTCGITLEIKYLYIVVSFFIN